MTNLKQKLELTWIGKDKRARLEPRIFIEDKTLSYKVQQVTTDANVAFNDNMLIHGDNLLALKALETSHSQSVNFIYIDPPFNTGGAFEHYDDGVEHSIWLSLMKQRLEILHSLLHDTGSIIVNLDDGEMAYCKVLMDEIFGRQNYITTIVVEAATSSSFKTANTGPVDVNQYLLFYAKNKSKLKFKPQYKVKEQVDLQHFSRFIVNPEAPCNEWVFKGINEHILEELGYKSGSIQSRWIKIKDDLGDTATSLVRQKANLFAIENAYRVFETKTLQKPSPYLKDKIEESKNIEFPLHVPRESYDDLFLLKGRQIYFLKNSIGEVDGVKGAILPLTTLWNDIPTNNLQREGGVRASA